MEEQKKDYDLIRSILNNPSLLKWVKKFSANGLSEDEKVAENFDIKTDKSSIVISDAENIKMFFSNAYFSGKRYVTIDISQLKEAIGLMNGKGRLIISEHEDKRLCYLQTDENVVVIAPITVDEEAPMESPKKTKKK